jgi:hypothetical protein
MNQSHSLYILLPRATRTIAHSFHTLAKRKLTMSSSLCVEHLLHLKAQKSIIDAWDSISKV